MTTTEHGLDYGCEACQQPTCTPDDPNCPARPDLARDLAANRGDVAAQDARLTSRVIPTADVLRALPYQAPSPGWHAHGMTLIPTDGCAACAELRARRDAEGPCACPACYVHGCAYCAAIGCSRHHADPRLYVPADGLPLPPVVPVLDFSTDPPTRTGEVSVWDPRALRFVRRAAAGGPTHDHEEPRP